MEKIESFLKSNSLERLPTLTFLEQTLSNDESLQGFHSSPIFVRLLTITLIETETPLTKCRCLLLLRRILPSLEEDITESFSYIAPTILAHFVFPHEGVKLLAKSYWTSYVQLVSNKQLVLDTLVEHGFQSNNDSLQNTVASDLVSLLPRDFDKYTELNVQPLINSLVKTMLQKHVDFKAKSGFFSTYDQLKEKFGDAKFEEMLSKIAIEPLGKEFFGLGPKFYEWRNTFDIESFQFLIPQNIIKSLIYDIDEQTQLFDIKKLETYLLEEMTRKILVNNLGEFFEFILFLLVKRPNYHTSVTVALFQLLIALMEVEKEKLPDSVDTILTCVACWIDLDDKSLHLLILQTCLVLAQQVSNDGVIAAVLKYFQATGHSKRKLKFLELIMFLRLNNAAEGTVLKKDDIFGDDQILGLEADIIRTALTCLISDCSKLRLASLECLAILLHELKNTENDLYSKKVFFSTVANILDSLIADTFTDEQKSLVHMAISMRLSRNKVASINDKECTINYYLNPNENVGYDVNWVRNGSSKDNGEQSKNEDKEKNETKTTTFDVKEETPTEISESRDEAQIESKHSSWKSSQVQSQSSEQKKKANKEHNTPVKSSRSQKESTTSSKCDWRSYPSTIETSKSLDSKLPKHFSSPQTSRLNETFETKIHNECHKRKKSRQRRPKYSPHEKMVIAKNLIMQSRSWLKWARNTEQENIVVKASLNKSCDKLKNEVLKESNTLSNKDFPQSLVPEKEKSLEYDDNKSLQDVVLKTSLTSRDENQSWDGEMTRGSLKSLEENIEENVAEPYNEEETDIYQLVFQYFEQEKQKNSDKRENVNLAAFNAFFKEFQFNRKTETNNQLKNEELFENLKKFLPLLKDEISKCIHKAPKTMLIDISTRFKEDQPRRKIKKPGNVFDKKKLKSFTQLKKKGPEKVPVADDTTHKPHTSENPQKKIKPSKIPACTKVRLDQELKDVDFFSKSDLESGHVYGSQQQIVIPKNKPCDENLKAVSNEDNVVEKSDVSREAKTDAEKKLVQENSFGSCESVDKIDKSDLKDFVQCLENPSKKSKKRANKTKSKPEPPLLCYGNFIKQDMNPKLEKIIGIFVRGSEKKEKMVTESIKSEGDKKETKDAPPTEVTKMDEDKNEIKEEAINHDSQHKMEVSAVESLNPMEISNEKFSHMEGQQVQTKTDIKDGEDDITDNCEVLNEDVTMETSEDRDINSPMQICDVNNNCSYDDNKKNNNNNNSKKTNNNTTHKKNSKKINNKNKNYNINNINNNNKNNDNDNVNNNNSNDNNNNSENSNDDEDSNNNNNNNNNDDDDNINKENIIDSTNSNNNVICYKTNYPAKNLVNKKNKKLTQVEDKKESISFFVDLDTVATNDDKDGDRQNSIGKQGSKGDEDGEKIAKSKTYESYSNNYEKSLAEAVAVLEIDDWENECHYMKMISNICFECPEAVRLQLLTITRSLNQEVQSLRSKVSLQAIATLGHMFSTMKKNMDGEVFNCVKILLTKCGESNRFIKDASIKSLEILVDETSIKKSLSALVAFGISHKNMAICEVSAMLLLRMLVNRKISNLLRNKEIASKLVPACLQLLVAGSQNARDNAQKCVGLLMEESRLFKKGLDKYVEPSLLSNARERLESVRNVVLQKSIEKVCVKDEDKCVDDVSPPSPPLPPFSSGENLMKEDDNMLLERKIPPYISLHPQKSIDELNEKLIIIDHKLETNIPIKITEGLQKLTEVMYENKNEELLLKILDCCINSLDKSDAKTTYQILSVFSKLIEKLNTVLKPRLETITSKLETLCLEGDKGLSKMVSKNFDSIMKFFDPFVIIDPLLMDAQNFKTQNIDNLVDRAHYVQLESLAKRPAETKKKMINLLWRLLSFLVEDRNVRMELFRNVSSILKSIPCDTSKIFQKRSNARASIKSKNNVMGDNTKYALDTSKFENELPSSLLRSKTKHSFESLGVKKYEKKLSKYQKCMAEQKKALDDIESYNINKTANNKDCNNHANTCLERLTFGVRDIIDRTGFIINNLTKQVLMGNYADNKTENVDWDQKRTDKIITEQPKANSMQIDNKTKNNSCCHGLCDISSTKKEKYSIKTCTKNKSSNNHLTNINRNEYRKYLVISLLKHLKLKQVLTKAKESRTQTNLCDSVDFLRDGCHSSEQACVVSTESIDNNITEDCDENEIWVNGEFKGFVNKC